MDDACRIRAASTADLAAVAAIEATAFPDPWSLGAFRAHLDDLFLVAETGNGVIGYVIAWSAGTEAEILNVAVQSAARRQGAGRALLREALDRLTAAGAAAVYLEVRRSNAAALALYRAAGFREVAVRRGYYQAPREDALVLRRDQGAPA